MPDLANLAPAIALAAIPTLVYLIALNAIDRYEKEPWTILIACVVLGAIVAPILSVAILTVLGRPSALLPQFAPGPGSGDPLIGLVEEIVNAGCLIALVWLVRDEFDDILDGVVYGAAIGAGFAATESFLFVLGGTSGLDAGSIGALLLAGLDHAFYGAIFGAVAGFAAGLHDASLARVLLVYGVASAALFHALHDTLPAILARLVGQPDAATGVGTRVIAEAVNILGIVTLAVVVWAAWRREGRVVHRRLADELESGVIGADDYATIGSIRARLRRQYTAFRRQGIPGVRAVRKLYATLGELAFVKERLEVRQRVRPPEGRVDELRAEIVRLRHQLGEEAS